MTRRGPREGTITHRKDGLWVAALHLGYADGKRQRKWLYGKSRAEVDDKLTRAKADHLRGIAVRTDERQTTGAYLERWLGNVEHTLRPRTVQGYRLIVAKHLIPTLGRVQLSKLTRDDVRGMVAHKRREGLSPQTLHNLHAVLRHAIEQAVRDDLVVRNVARGIDLPRVERTEVRAVSHADAVGILEAVRGDRIEPMVIVAMTCGLRQGELLGLKWEDIDLDLGQIHVRRSLQRLNGEVKDVPTKTPLSRRDVAMPALAVDALGLHRDRQRFDERWAGSRWHSTGYVFTSTIGTPVTGGDLTKRFQARLAAAGLPRMRWHDLRHATATLMLAAGEHPKVVQELLGHSTMAVTMAVYSHVIPSLKRDAADRMDALLKQAIS